MYIKTVMTSFCLHSKTVLQQAHLIPYYNNPGDTSAWKI
jgi:hypothetical protein